ncbi:MAG: type II secretion system protein [Candidatus Ryanbacteria bacterium]|nr:type II secretion system protein [Candidatus Ryanbacteria bacterium]
MKNKSGFTLIELMVLLTIFAFIAIFVVPQFAAYHETTGKIRSYNSELSAEANRAINGDSSVR